ncbi:MAG: mandelate racemase/muconate lactonizing enzyme family protein [SAR202 cluster bacterium]|mgnify:FL=1|nr:mandelate racemase/muconate lactonizing enzyme family protein [SAR202 cluster bacterium]|tara:strand:+ start:1095 stop:2237 length:1143 start_codon:yes stop_codon:yes gene_type:complete
MKITKIETLIGTDTSHGNLVYVRTHTDAGIYGIGEVYHVGPDMASHYWVDYFSEQLIGQDPTEIERNWALCYQGARFPIGSSGLAALSAIDVSLWDITGKLLEKPIHELFGGRVRDRIRAYWDIHGDTPKELAEDARKFVDQGYTALKASPLSPNWRDMRWNDALTDSAARFKAIRQAVGDDIDVGFDAHAAIFEPIRVLEISEALMEFNPWFIEEPLRMENRYEMGRLRQKMNCALATGECLYTKFEMWDLIREGGVDILQPEVCIVGGLTEMRKIAFLAEAHDLVIAPHNPMGPLATVANLHFDAATSNFLVQESRTMTPFEIASVTNVIRPIDGYYPIPEEPGLGIDLVEEEFTTRPYSKSWHRGDRVNPDHSIAYI